MSRSGVGTRDRYRAFCATPEGDRVPVFSHPWWLDAVCGEGGWDVALVEEGGEVRAALPYWLTRRAGFRIITQPPLTQILGPHIVQQHFRSEAERLSVEKDLFTRLIERLPAANFIKLHAHYRYGNWLPFYWRGFEQTTRYTYVIEDLASDWEGAFDYSKRKDIKKASAKLQVTFDIGPEVFYDHHVQSLSKQGRRIGYSRQLFHRIHAAAYANGAGCTIGARDASGHLHAALFVIWGREGAYDLISTIDPDLRSSGAASLLVRDIIRHVRDRAARFDFEGSMDEGIEASFRRFGATQKAYSAIERTPSAILRARRALHILLGRA